MQTLINSEVADLSNVSAENQKFVKSVLEQTNLDWDVRGENLVSSPSNLPTKALGIFRNDNHAYLGVTSERYQIYQNSELVEVIATAAQDFNLKIDDGGFLFDGERVYLHLQLPTEYIVNSEVKRYITAINSHNGKGSVGFGATNDIFDISNGGVMSRKFFKVFGEMSKFRHTANVSTKVNAAVKSLFSSVVQENEQLVLMQKMAEVKVNDALLRDVILNCYKVDLNNRYDDIPTRQKNKIERVSEIISNEVKRQDGTLWGLFTGVLAATEDCTPKKSDKTDYIMGGSGYGMNMKAYRILENYLAKSLK